MTTLANFSAESKKSSLRIFKEQQVWFYKKVFSSSCSSGQLLQFWRIWRIFSPLCHKLQYPSKKLEIFNSFFQKPCFVSVPLDTYNLVLNSKPKLFQCVPILPGQRSKLMRNQLSKNAFAEVFSPGHVCYSFEDRAIFFHYKSKYVCLQSDNYKKHDYSELIFLTIFLCTRWLLFRHTRIVSWPRDEKNSLKVQKIQKNKTKSILKKKKFRNFFLWTRWWHLWQPWRKLSDQKVLNFGSDSEEVWNIAQNFRRGLSSIHSKAT